MIYELRSQQPAIPADVFIAPSADIIGDVILKPESSIWFGAVLRGDIEPITIGRGTNIQDGTVCHTDPDNPCTIGEFVTVGHMAMLHGCEVGDGSLIGIGATLLNGSKIGRNCIVGAHALVTEDKSFPDNTVIMGTPAKIMRDIDGGDLKVLKANAERYIERAKRYLAELEQISPPG
ncbi:MAG: gamma carbonic anhydrase family protein [Gammaproteobacteria bacterium]|nr:gamma carbonic anhydrase family protein [Gammaproteobacteria bacterium]MDP6616305.1 gamma carbonic anhydrase family protein [Gammaproteobacteria bacterium]MDP6694019.1 gamma carbonic anhydrase family protein [Gammaproteobacteria bacterium]MDP7041814.1 gamma carbonic anhydrase family protein [Gammaproteobacteria bacterium]